MKTSETKQVNPVVLPLLRTSKVFFNILKIRKTAKSLESFASFITEQSENQAEDYIYLIKVALL